MCEYCEKEKRLAEYETDNIYAYIYGKHLKIIGKYPLLHNVFGRDIIINYCPICGRKLGDD